MTADELINEFGYDRFQALSQRAWASAANTGYGAFDVDEEVYQADFDLATDIVEEIWLSRLNEEGKVGLVFDFYRRAPSYTWLDQVHTFWFSTLTERGRNVFWRELRRLLSENDDRLANPATYLLWCGPFEDPEEVTDVWYRMLGRDADRLRLQRLLISSGPVPYELKRQLYEQLRRDSEWHYYIFRSLLHSAFDLLGQLDKEDAKRILEQLRLPSDTEHLRRLQERLNE